MEKNKNYIIAALAIFSLFLLVSLASRNKEIESLKETNTEISTNSDQYSDALDEANANIEIANDRIGDAQSNSWASYDDMGNALDDLEPVDTVSQP